jgi:hypothetical protein
MFRHQNFFSASDLLLAHQDFFKASEVVHFSKPHILNHISVLCKKTHPFILFSAIWAGRASFAPVVGLLVFVEDFFQIEWQDWQHI